MSLLEINIEKPALVEERVYPDKESAPATARTKSESSGQSIASLLRPVLGLLLVAGLALLVRKRGAASDEDESTASETDDAEAQSGGRGVVSVVGVLGAVLGAVALVRKVRGGSADE